MEGGGGAPEDERSTQAIKKAHPLSDNETLISIILSLTDHHLMIKGAPEDERSMHAIKESSLYNYPIVLPIICKDEVWRGVAAHPRTRGRRRR